jgi:hypothetical protein
VANSKQDNYLEQVPRSDGEEKKISREHRKEDSQSRKPSRTNSIWQQDNGHENVEDTRQHEEMANTDSERRCGGEADRENAENVGQSSRHSWDGWWDIEPNVGRVAHGVSSRVHRLKSLGNSLVPSIPYYIGLSIIQSYMANTDGEKSFDSETSRDNGEDR